MTIATTPASGTVVRPPFRQAASPSAPPRVSASPVPGPAVFVTFPQSVSVPDRVAIRETAMLAYPGARLRFAFHYPDDARLTRAIATSGAFLFAPGRGGWIGTGVVSELKLARSLGRRCFAIDPATRTLHEDVFVAERAVNNNRRVRVVRLAFTEPYAGAQMLIVNPRAASSPAMAVAQ